MFWRAGIEAPPNFSFRLSGRNPIDGDTAIDDTGTNSYQLPMNAADASLAMRAFSFEKQPFSNVGERDFYFSTPALTARLEELSCAVESGHVLLIDEPGSGKSTMLDNFVASAAERWRIFRLHTGEHHTAKEFAHSLVSTFGLPFREPIAAELRDADTLLELLTTRSQLAVIVIDDVHRLEIGALEQLVYLTKRWESYSVRFLICAEPGLLEKIESLPEDNRLAGHVTRFGMPRFDHEQVGDYLHMCLFRAGLVGDSPFDHTLVSKVTERARGLVGAIDAIARELLEESAADGKHLGGDDTPPGGSRRWSVAIVAAAGLGALLMFAFPGVSTTHDGVESRARSQVFRSSITPAARESAGSGHERSAPADLAAP